MPTPTAPAPIAESHPTSRSRPTASASSPPKASAQQILGARGIPFTAVRFFNTFGPGQTYTPYVGVITIFVTRLLRGEAPTIFGDGEQRRDFVHVDDIVAGDAGGTGRATGTYNLGTGRGTSLNEAGGAAHRAAQPALTPQPRRLRPASFGIRSRTSAPRARRWVINRRGRSNTISTG